MKTAADLLKNLEDVALAVIKAQSESPLESKDYINTVTANIGKCALHYVMLLTAEYIYQYKLAFCFVYLNQI